MQQIVRKELNTRAKHKGATRCIVSHCIHNYYFCDLIDFSSKRDTFIQQCIDENEELDMRKKNKGNNYVLVVIDGYSRFVMCKIMKSKKPKEVIKCFTEIINEFGMSNNIVCDYGGEFVNSTFKSSILDKFNIKMMHMSSENKSVLAERAIRTIKELIRSDFIESNGVWYQYINSAVQTMNHRVNKTTGYTPNDVFNDHIIYREKVEPNNLEAKDITPQFAINDSVRVAIIPNILQKRSLSYRWSKDVHTITSIDTQFMPIIYHISGTNKPYYHWQLLKSKCNPTIVNNNEEQRVTTNETSNETNNETSNVPRRYNTRHKRIDFTRYA